MLTWSQRPQVEVQNTNMTLEILYCTTTCHHCAVFHAEFVPTMYPDPTHLGRTSTSQVTQVAWGQQNKPQTATKKGLAISTCHPRKSAPTFIAEGRNHTHNANTSRCIMHQGSTETHEQMDKARHVGLPLGWPS
jgi:hypothetical protein